MRGILPAMLALTTSVHAESELAPVVQPSVQSEAKIREKIDDLAAALKEAKTPQAFQFAAQKLHGLSFDAEKADLYELVGKILEQAMKAAQIAKDADLTASIQERLTVIRSLVSEYARVRPAKTKLESNPDDKASNTTVGKWLCFMKGDWGGGLAHLEKGSDEKLAKVAARDRGAGEDPDVKTACSIGDEWRSIHPPRAIHWYGIAWPKLDPLQREPVRQKIRSILRRPAQPKLGELSSGWRAEKQSGSEKGVGTDTEYAKTGRYSAKLLPGGFLRFDFPIVSGKKYEISGWVLSDSDDGHNRFGVSIGNPSLSRRIDAVSIPKDQPYWTYVKKTFGAIGGDRGAFVAVISESKTGAVWVDDILLRELDTGAELLINGGFERR
jgi:hypothetical protein